MLAFARSRAIGVSTVVTMGNESMISTADVLGYLADDEQTRVICLFLEEISEPDRFARAAGQAAKAGKPVVVLKTGSSPAGQVAALAHTGSVAGDDAVVDAVLRQLGVIRVTSIEELLSTAGLLGYDRWPRGRRMGVLTASGGACGLIADRASEQDIKIPPFAARTVAAIEPHLPAFADARNPLDVTGYVLANPRVTALTAIDHALDAALADPGLDFVLFCGVTAPEVRPPDERLARLARGAGALAGRTHRVRADPGHLDGHHLRRRVRLRPGSARQARRPPARRHRPGHAGSRPRAALAGEPPGRRPPAAINHSDRDQTGETTT